MINSHTNPLSGLKVYRYKDILGSIFKIAIPISLQAALIAGLQLVDSLFLGHLENAEYAASGVNAVNNVTFVIFTVITGFIGGIGIYLINSAAKKDLVQQRNIFRIKFIWMMILSVIFLPIATILIKPIASLWIADNNSQASSFAGMYGSLIIPSILLSNITLLFSDTYRQTKVIRITVIISIFAFLLNSILNYLLMYVANMGLKGGGVATVIARAFEMIVWIIYVSITKPEFIPKFKTWLKISSKKVFHVFPKCAIWTLNAFLISLSFTFKILLLSRISIESGASMISAGVFIQLFRGFLAGYATAVSILIVGEFSNARKDLAAKKNIKIYLKKVSIISLLFGIIIGVIGSSFSPMIFILFPKYSNNMNVQSIIMIISISLFMPIGLLNDVPKASLKGMGISKALVIGDSLFGWIVIIPVLLCLVYYDGITLSYGWIYAITVFIGIAQPPILFYLSNKAIDNGRFLKIL